MSESRLVPIPRGVKEKRVQKGREKELLIISAGFDKGRLEKSQKGTKVEIFLRAEDRCGGGGDWHASRTTAVFTGFAAQL